jgi:hypothetical protein
MARDPEYRAWHDLATRDTGTISDLTLPEFCTVRECLKPFGHLDSCTGELTIDDGPEALSARKHYRDVCTCTDCTADRHQSMLDEVINNRIIDTTQIVTDVESVYTKLIPA